jgi:hypothetical protein
MARMAMRIFGLNCLNHMFLRTSICRCVCSVQAIHLGGCTGEGFKEGVSLTVYDELNRWEKYAYGCNELLFHSFRL